MKNLILNPSVQHIVLVNASAPTRTFPKTLFDGSNFHSDDVLEKARALAAHELTRTSILGPALGFGVFHRLGMYSYTYRVYGVTPNGAVELGAVHKVEEVEAMVRAYHEGLGAIEERVEKLRGELGRHDWYCAMSDAPGVWRAGETHMRQNILPLLASLPPDEAQALWAEYAPEGFGFPL